MCRRTYLAHSKISGEQLVVTVLASSPQVERVIGLLERRLEITDTKHLTILLAFVKDLPYAGAESLCSRILTLDDSQWPSIGQHLLGAIILPSKLCFFQFIGLPYRYLNPFLLISKYYY